MNLNAWAAWATVVSGILIPAIGLGVWALKKLRTYIVDEVAKGREILECQVVPKLTNGGTTGAQYAREARDLASKSLEMSIVTDARCKRLEEKMDLFVLGWEEQKNSASLSRWRQAYSGLEQRGFDGWRPVQGRVAHHRE